MGEYPWIVRFALDTADWVVLVALAGTTSETARASDAVANKCLLFSNSLRLLTIAEVVPTTGRLLAISALVGQYTGIELMVLMDETNTVVPVWYSKGRLSDGVHNCGVVVTNLTSVSAFTEVTLNVKRPPGPALTPIHTSGTQLADPSHDTQ